MDDGKARLIAVDWGTTRMRAALIDANGRVIARVSSDEGVQSVAAGGFPAALETACRTWFSSDPNLPVLMSGMVGSRNGWIEAPYVSPACGAADLAARLVAVSDAARAVSIVPGVDCRSEDGSYDVMRGEETQAIGAGVSDGLVCLPGTHSKWVEVAGGDIIRFVTFATGELYAALVHSFLGRLAEEPDDGPAGSALAQSLAALPGGLTRAVFQARAQVLGRGMTGHAVRPYLSALLIETEIQGALDLFGAGRPVSLVAADPQLRPYATILRRRGFDVTVVEPEAATLNGQLRIAGLRGLITQGSAA